MSKYVKKGFLAHRPKLPEHMQGAVDEYYKTQIERLGYVRYHVRYDYDVKEYQIDAMSKPARYSKGPSEVYSLDRPIKQLLLRTARIGLDEEGLLEFMRENYGRRG